MIDHFTEITNKTIPKTSPKINATHPGLMMNVGW